MDKELTDWAKVRNRIMEEQGCVDKMDGVERIRKERERQKSVEGWTAEHDDKYTTELLQAAIDYTNCTLGMNDGFLFRAESTIPEDWPWHSDWWKPSENKIRNLEKAGALIAAEIDRLVREDQLERENDAIITYHLKHGERNNVDDYLDQMRVDIGNRFA